MIFKFVKAKKHNSLVEFDESEFSWKQNVANTLHHTFLSPLHYKSFFHHATHTKGYKNWQTLDYRCQKSFLSPRQFHTIGNSTSTQNIPCFNLITRNFKCFKQCWAVLRIRIRIHMFLGLQDPDPDPLVRGMDPDQEHFLQSFCIKILFCKQYFSLLNTFMKKREGSRSIHLTNGSGSGRPKNMRILLRISNTGFKYWYL